MPSTQSTYFLQQHMKSKARALERHLAEETNTTGQAERSFLKEVAAWSDGKYLQPFYSALGKYRLQLLSLQI